MLLMACQFQTVKSLILPVNIFSVKFVNMTFNMTFNIVSSVSTLYLMLLMTCQFQTVKPLIFPVDIFSFKFVNMISI